LDNEESTFQIVQQVLSNAQQRQKFILVFKI